MERYQCASKFSIKHQKLALVQLNKLRIGRTSSKSTLNFIYFLSIYLCKLEIVQQLETVCTSAKANNVSLKLFLFENLTEAIIEWIAIESSNSSCVNPLDENCKEKKKSINNLEMSLIF